VLCENFLLPVCPGPEKVSLTRELDGDLIVPFTGNPQQAKHAQTDSKFKRSQQKRCFNAESVEFRLAI
jgi:hypothetical protein